MFCFCIFKAQCCVVLVPLVDLLKIHPLIRDENTDYWQTKGNHTAEESGKGEWVLCLWFWTLAASFFFWLLRLAQLKHVSPNVTAQEAAQGQTQLFSCFFFHPLHNFCIFYIVYSSVALTTFLFCLFLHLSTLFLHLLNFFTFFVLIFLHFFLQFFTSFAFLFTFFFTSFAYLYFLHFFTSFTLLFTFLFTSF